MSHVRSRSGPTRQHGGRRTGTVTGSCRRAPARAPAYARYLPICNGRDAPSSRPYLSENDRRLKRRTVDMARRSPAPVIAARQVASRLGAAGRPCSRALVRCPAPFGSAQSRVTALDACVTGASCRRNGVSRSCHVLESESCRGLRAEGLDQLPR